MTPDEDDMMKHAAMDIGLTEDEAERAVEDNRAGY